MKNFVLILMLSLGFASMIEAQNCQPCPVGAICPKDCCVSVCKTPGASSAQALPSNIDFSAVLVSQPKASGLGVASVNNCDVKACQAACLTGNTPPACQGATSVSNTDLKACKPACNTSSTPGCQSAKTTTSTEKKMDQQYHAVPKPMKS